MIRNLDGKNKASRLSFSGDYMSKHSLYKINIATLYVIVIIQQTWSYKSKISVN